MSQKQSQANKRNAQASTGPRTQSGKGASSQNALKHGLNQALDPLSDPRFPHWVAAFVNEGYEKEKASKAAEALLSHRRVMQAFEASYLEQPDPMALMTDEVIDEFLSEQALAAFMTVNKRERKTLINILSPKANRGSEVTQRVRRLTKLNRYLQKSAATLSKALKPKKSQNEPI